MKKIQIPQTIKFIKQYRRKRNTYIDRLRFDWILQRILTYEPEEEKKICKSLVVYKDSDL
jgi:hypothetical protein